MGCNDPALGEEQHHAVPADIEGAHAVVGVGRLKPEHVGVGGHCAIEIGDVERGLKDAGELGHERHVGGLCSPTPTPTRAIPINSTEVGTCWSTSAPTTAAVAGRSASRSAKVARGSRAIASWSQT